MRAGCIHGGATLTESARVCAATQSETPEVTRDDQANINSFGRLNNRLHELDAELEGKKARRSARVCCVALFAC